MSGKTVLAVLLIADGVQAAEPITAEQLMDRYRETFPTIDALDCPPVEGEEIVVCARRDSSQDQRLPLPIEDAGRRVRGDTPLPREHIQSDASHACVSNKGCAKATIPIISVGRRDPGAPDPVVDTIVNAIERIATSD